MDNLLSTEGWKIEIEAQGHWLSRVLGCTETHLVPHLDSHSALFFWSYYPAAAHSVHREVIVTASPRSSCSVGRETDGGPGGGVQEEVVTTA